MTAKTTTTYHELLLSKYDAETGMAPCGACGRWTAAARSLLNF